MGLDENMSVFSLPLLQRLIFLLDSFFSCVAAGREREALCRSFFYYLPMYINEYHSQSMHAVGFMCYVVYSKGISSAFKSWLLYCMVVGTWAPGPPKSTKTYRRPNFACGKETNTRWNWVWGWGRRMNPPEGWLSISGPKTGSHFFISLFHLEQ